MRKFLLTYIFSLTALATLYYCLIIFVSIHQTGTTIALIDTQASIALRSAVRECQSSVDDGGSITSTSDPRFMLYTPEFYKFYFDYGSSSSGVKASTEYSDYLYRLKYPNSMDDAYNILTDSIDYSTGIIPMDLALPYVQLKSTAMSSANKDSVLVPRLDGTGTSVETFDSDVASKVDQYLTLSVGSSLSNYIRIEDTEGNCEGIPDIEVELVNDSIHDVMHFTSNDSSSPYYVGKVLGPVYMGDTDDTFLVNSNTVPYFDIGVKVTYTLKITIPMLNLPVWEIPVTKEYYTRYSLLN